MKRSRLMRRAQMRVSAQRAAALDVYPPADPILRRLPPAEMIRSSLSSFQYKYGLNNDKLIALIGRELK